MSFGCRTWSGSGVLEMDTDTFTYQVLHNQQYQLTLGAVITVPVSGFTTSSCVAVVLPTQAPDWEFAGNAMPYVSVADGVITVRSKHPLEPTVETGSTIQFRLLAMRYKN